MNIAIAKSRSRKRIRNPESWKQNIRKTKRNRGEEYTSRNGKAIPARKQLQYRCGACVNKCNERLPDHVRSD